LVTQFAAQLAPADQPAVVILQTPCVSCHGGPEPVRNLDLSTREGALRGGGRGPAIVPGDVLESILYRTITHQHDLKMPFNKPKLPDAEGAERYLSSVGKYPRGGGGSVEDCGRRA